MEKDYVLIFLTALLLIIALKTAPQQNDKHSKQNFTTKNLYYV